MQAAYLADAQPEAVSHAVRDVLERRGALVREHRPSRVLFDGPPTGEPWSWTRTGYVGIFQHLGEKEVEVALRLRARWPARILWIVALANVILAVATAILNPPGTTWFLMAMLTGFALLVAALVQVGTLKRVRAEERRLIAEFEEEFAKGLPQAVVETQEERELREAEAALEGELTRRRVDRERRPAAKPQGSRFRLRPKKEEPAATQPASADDLEARRQALLARKAELEAKRRNQPPGQ